MDFAKAAGVRRSETIPAVPLEGDFRSTSCFSKQIDKARGTISFVRNGTSSAIAVNPAAGSQTFGVNGMSGQNAFGTAAWEVIAA
jgi:hypothetical protein